MDDLVPVVPGARHRRADTSSSAGAKIVAAFEEAIGVMRSGGPVAAKLTARTYRADFAAADYGPDDVQRVRGAEDEPNPLRPVPRRRRQHGPVLGARHPLPQRDRPALSWEDRIRPRYWKRRVVHSLVATSNKEPTEA